MISNEAWRELVAAVVGREHPQIYGDGRTVILTYEEIESAPDIEVTWNPDLEVVTIEVKS